MAMKEMKDVSYMIWRIPIFGSSQPGYHSSTGKLFTVALHSRSLLLLASFTSSRFLPQALLYLLYDNSRLWATLPRTCFSVTG